MKRLAIAIPALMTVSIGCGARDGADSGGSPAALDAVRQRINDGADCG